VTSEVHNFMLPLMKQELIGTTVLTPEATISVATMKPCVRGRTDGETVRSKKYQAQMIAAETDGLSEAKAHHWLPASGAGDALWRQRRCSPKSCRPPSGLETKGVRGEGMSSVIDRETSPNTIGNARQSPFISTKTGLPGFGHTADLPSCR